MSRCLLFLWIWVLFGSCLHGGTLVVFHTVRGDIEVELFDQEKPITVDNFIRYAERVYSTNQVIFHRLLPGFVLQGGGYSITNRASTNFFENFSSVFRFPSIRNEFAAGPLRSNVLGTIAMAKRGNDPNSANAEWFFNLGDNSANLDKQNGGFTVFGQVVGGMDVLLSFNKLFKRVDAVSCLFRGVADLSCYREDIFGDLFSDLPVTYTLTRYPRYHELFVVEISVMRLRVYATVSGARSLIWRTIKGRQNLVEYSDLLPPVWRPLETVNGDGAEQTVVDSEGALGTRLYRVRVAYP